MLADPTLVVTNHGDSSGGKGAATGDSDLSPLSRDRRLGTLDPEENSPPQFERSAVISAWMVGVVTLSAIPLRVFEWALRRDDRQRIRHPLMDGRSATMRYLFDHIRGWRALAALYDESVLEGEEDPQQMRAWYKVAPAQSVRNRLRIVQRLLDEAIAERYQATDKEVRIISLACGSAVAVLQAVARAKAQGIPARAILVDHKESSLHYARQRAEELCISDRVETRVGNVLTFFGESTGLEFDICEMVGLLDYLSPEQAVTLMQEIRQFLPSGGVFLTANVSRNWAHMAFVRLVMRWWMIHRTQAEVAELLVAAGFSAENLQFHEEPHHGHHTVAATK